MSIIRVPTPYLFEEKRKGLLLHPITAKKTIDLEEMPLTHSTIASWHGWWVSRHFNQEGSTPYCLLALPFIMHESRLICGT